MHAPTVSRRQARRLVREAKLVLIEARRMLRQNEHRISEKAASELRGAILRLEEFLLSSNLSVLAESMEALEELLDRHLLFARKSVFREYIESIGAAILVALFLRAFVIEAFKIPSGSMIPTLLVGDHIFVNKFIYGIRVPGTDIKFFANRKPERGEVIVFRFPNPFHIASEENKDFIKRIVAIEGDTVEIRDRVLYVNGRPVSHEPVGGNKPCVYEDLLDEGGGVFLEKRCEAFVEHIGGRTFTTYYNQDGEAPRNWPPRIVPKGTVFCMGDNRDNSHDSRYWGPVPIELVKGRAMFIWWSSGREGLRTWRLLSWVT